MWTTATSFFGCQNCNVLASTATQLVLRQVKTDSQLFSRWPLDARRRLVCVAHEVKTIYSCLLLFLFIFFFLRFVVFRCTRTSENGRSATVAFREVWKDCASRYSKLKLEKKKNKIFWQTTFFMFHGGL